MEHTTMEKKKYIRPMLEVIEISHLCDGETVAWSKEDENAGANKGNFDEEDDDNFFTPVATSLWD